MEITSMNLPKLRLALDTIINDPTLQPKGGVTYCNLAVQRVLNIFDYHGIDGMMANAICDYLLLSPDWMVIDGGTVQVAANEGHIGMAAHKYVEHGHVAIIAPGQLVFSGHWGCLCPIVANVGKTVGYMPANLAFPVVESQPGYWLLKGDVK